jgi:peptide/nickel transport system permease protein
MTAYIIRRLLLIVPVMWLVATVAFFLLHMTPGDPVAVLLGPDATTEQVDRMREELGLNEPLLVQYVTWLWDVVRLDLGNSLFLNMPVIDAILERAQPTILLTLSALIVAVGIGIPTGVISAVRRGSAIDFGAMLGAMVGISMPTFWLGLNLIFIFAVTLRWLPIGGYTPLLDDPVDSLKRMIMPAFTLGAFQAAFLARITRSVMLDVLNEDYIRTARAKGLMERRVVIRHALRNTMIPLVTVIGLSFALLIGGAVVTEQVFNIPGVGRLLIQAVLRRDFPVIQGIVLTIAFLYVIINLIVDVFYVFLDPRVHYS